MFEALKRWLHKKTAPPCLSGPQWTGTGFVDSFKRNRNPTPNELMAELKGVAWTCASINAQVCAANPPVLYTSILPSQNQPKFATRPVKTKQLNRLRSLPHLPLHVKSAQIRQVEDHPLLTLINQPNPFFNSFDLWEMTTIYQETHGSAYWYLSPGPGGLPSQIWILPSQNVTPHRDPDTQKIVDSYLYSSGLKRQSFDPDSIIHFRYPDPRDPYTGGLSPLRAAFEQASVLSDYAAFKTAKIQNRAIPDAIVSPDEVIGEEERDRLEAQWNSKFRTGGAGRIVVGESGLKVQLLNQSLGDIALLADVKMTKEDIANAFHVPLSFLSTNTNLANLQASQGQHMAIAIGPRLARRDQKLNEQLVPMFDPTGRLFFASEDPLPQSFADSIAQQEFNLKYGVLTINELRTSEGLDPVPWGDVPWMPLQWAKTDFPGREQVTQPHIGRNNPHLEGEENADG